MKINRSKYLPLIILLALSLLIGLLTIHHYGESWDEYNFYNYAEESISAYQHFFSPQEIPDFHDPTLRYYGPWLLMLIVQIAKLFPNWIISDVGHLLTFLVFQIGIVILYLLSRRWMKSWSALGVSLLFASQPVFWGHAFINSRDIPFMVGFIATIYFGLRMSDSLALTPEKESPPKVDPAPIARADWEKLPKWARIILPLASLIGIVVLVTLSISLAGHWLAQGLPNTDTSSARDLDLYLRPLLNKFWAGVFFFLSSLLLSSALYLPFMPDFRKYLWRAELGPVYELLKSLLSNKKLLIASLALGLTVGIRIMGFAAAGLVGVIHLIRRRKEGVPALLVYGLLAFPIVYITWPYLWGEPVLRLAITLKVMMRFPWPGQVLYDGNFYDANMLPSHYLPKLLSYQLTEPLLLLLAIGFVFAIFQFFHREKMREMLLLAGMWFLLPLGAAIFSKPYLYDNFRQILFTLPPLFLIAGLGLEALFIKIRKPVFRSLILLAIAIPGVVVGIQLHPYEYIYYNSFTRGTQGAFRQYEMDYWGTALRETAVYVNENSKEDADIVVWGPATVLWRYARPDLKIYDARQDNLPSENFYAVISSRHNNDLLVYPDIAPEYILDKNGVILAVVKYVE